MPFRGFSMNVEDFWCVLGVGKTRKCEEVTPIDNGVNSPIIGVDLCCNMGTTLS